jgi:hypothetical protein
MRSSERPTSPKLLELDEMLTRYWLSLPLPPEKRIEWEQHLKESSQGPAAYPHRNDENKRLNFLLFSL